MIYTENKAGGDRKAHKTIEAAARRIALDDSVYLGYVLAGCDGKHEGMESDVEQRVEELREEAIQ